MNTHYIIPPQIRLVEVMTSGSTHDKIFNVLFQNFRESGMVPVKVHAESTGFIVNRIWAAVKRESLMVLSEGVASPEELDAAWTEMFIRGGNPPCAMMDAVGLDTVSLIEKHYIEERNLPDTGVLPFLQKYIDQGKLGAKSSKGGLYPPGHTTKTVGENQTAYDNINAPALYILDLGLANDPNDAYQRGRILVGSADGKSPLRTVVDNQPLPDGIALSPAAGKLFWTNMGVPNINDGSVMSCNLDGTDIKTIIPKGVVHTPKQLAYDHTANKLYFCDREGMRVFRCNPDGTGLETLIQTGDWKKGFNNDKTLWCVGIAVAPREGKFYWTQKGQSKGFEGKILRASINMPPGADASNRKDIECLFSKLPEPIDLEIDEDDRAMYWTDRGELPEGNSLNRVALDETGAYGCRQILARNLHEAIGLAIDKKNRHIYATGLYVPASPCCLKMDRTMLTILVSISGGAVYRFNMDGKDRRKFYEEEGAFAGIALCDV